MRRSNAQHQIEQVGSELRAMMPWLNAGNKKSEIAEKKNDLRQLETTHSRLLLRSHPIERSVLRNQEYQREISLGDTSRPIQGGIKTWQTLR